MTPGGCMMGIGLCRVSVQTDHDDPPVVVDLALPTGTELSALLPSIVDIVCGRGQTTDLADSTAQRWQMSRLGGSPLDDSMTLHECGVRDGELLILTPDDTPVQVPMFDHLSHAVATVSESANRAQRVSGYVGAAACLWAAGVSGILLGWFGVRAPSGRQVLIAGILACTATVAAIIASRVRPEPLPGLTMSLVAIAFATVTGHLAVPDGPAGPNLCLAAVAGSTVSIVLLRVTACGTVCLTAIATCLATVAVAAAAAVVWPIPGQAVGAGLAVVSLAMLGVAAKLSIALSGLSPAVPTADSAGDDEDIPFDVGAASVIRGHETLTGLLVGFSAAAASGTLLAAIASHRGGEAGPRAVALTAVVGAVLMLRARHQIGVTRTAAVFGSGLLSVTATFVLVAFSAPRQAHWVSALAVVCGVAALCLTLVDVEARLSPVARRSGEILEYLALVAVVPVACWVADLFGVVRGLSLA
ncbi:MAG: type VII secretion integral membrane protein EccD [Mycobacterium sp.]